VSLLAGAVSFDDSWSPDDVAMQMARETCRYPHLKSHVLIHDRRFACYVIDGQAQDADVIRIPAPGNMSAFVVGEIASPPKGSQAARWSPQDPSSVLDWNGCWTAIFYDHDAGSVRLAADVLGTAWVYIAQCPKGYLFCSDFGALMSGLPAPPKPDHETLLVTLGISYSPDDRTCFEDITVLPAGQLVELNERGIETISRRQVAYGARHVDLPTERKFELMDALFADAARDWCIPFASDLLVSLSGGYDSRYGLGVLLANEIRPRCLTFGHPRSSDARRARKLCEELGLDFTLYTVGTTSWDVWRRCVEQSGSVGGFQWANGWAEEWLKLLGRNGSHVLLGYLGDALSGKHLVQYDSRESAWLDNWERWSLDEGWSDSPLVRPEANEALRECVRARFSRMIRDISFAFPHQQALHLDWYGRQRRFVAAQPNLIRRFLAPILFLYSDYMLDFWANVPFDDLRGQALYLRYAQHRFPAVFKEEPAARLHDRVWGTMTNALIAAFPAATNYFRAPEIDIKSIVARHKASVVSTVKDVESLIGQVFDMKALLSEIEAFPQTNRLTSVQLSRLINVCLLLRLGLQPTPRAAR
jgi:hypothetical protein